MDNSYIEEIAEIIASTTLAIETVDSELAGAMANVDHANSIDTTAPKVEMRDLPRDNPIHPFIPADMLIKELYFNNTKIGKMIIRKEKYNSIRITLMIFKKQNDF